MPIEDRQRVWLWLAYMMRVEADSDIYAHPRREGWEECVDLAETAGDRFYEKAGELAPLGDDAWRRAVEALGAPA